MSEFIGKDVSIRLSKDLGFFQGTITKVTQNKITLASVFRNGVRMVNKSEVEIGKETIESIEFIERVDPTEAASRSIQNTPVGEKRSPPRQQSRSAQKSAKSPANFVNKPQGNQTKPIAILQRPTENNGLSSSYNQLNGSKKIKKQKNPPRNAGLLQPDFSENKGDFDFEFSNSLFNKTEIFKEIDDENDKISGQKQPDLVRQLHKPEEKYRHDENVLDSMFMQFRNIGLEFKPKQEYTTDEAGIIIPSIPQSLRNRIQNLAADHGHSMERQNDFLARGATELALNLLGGSRRLSPKNLHQWPKVTIICDDAYNFRQSEIGLSTARQLASHGLKVMVYVKTSCSTSDRTSKELELFTATGNDFTGNVSELFASDLVIMSVSNMNQNSQIVRYVQQNRAMIMAIDPPATGLSEIPIRNAVLPILPLDDIHNTCGKLHLVNIGISEKFYKDAGVKYSPIFGSKFIIPLHLKL